MDGGIDLTMEVGGTTELKGWILGWGASAEVLAPEELRREVAEEAHKMASKYGRP